MNTLRVPRRDTFVFSAVDQKNGNSSSNHRALRAGLFQIDSSPPPRVQHAHFDNGPKECAPQTLAGAKPLAQPVVSDLAKRSEGRFGYDRGERLVLAQRLQNQGSAHGLAEAEHTAGLVLAAQPRRPGRDVACFEHAVGGQVPAALSMRARIRQQHAVSMTQKKQSVATHAFSVVGNAVQQHDGTTVAIGRAGKPRTQSYTVGSRRFGVLQDCPELLRQHGRSLRAVGY